MYDGILVREGDKSGRFNSSRIIDDSEENQFTTNLTITDMTKNDNGKESVLQVHNILGTVNFTFVTVDTRRGISDPKGIFL